MVIVLQVIKSWRYICILPYTHRLMFSSLIFNRTYVLSIFLSQSSLNCLASYSQSSYEKCFTYTYTSTIYMKRESPCYLLPLFTWCAFRVSYKHRGYNEISLSLVRIWIPITIKNFNSFIFVYFSRTFEPTFSTRITAD